MAFTIDDFNKVWASTSPLTPYSFSEANYKQGWNFIGSTPPARQMWDSLQKNNDEKMQYLANNYLPLNGSANMTGTIVTADNVGMKKSDNNGRLNFYSGTAYQNGSSLILTAKDDTNAGSFYLQANNGTNNASLEGKYDGTLKWNENDVLTASNYNSYALPLSGGTMSGSIISVMENPTERTPLRIKYTGITSGVSPASDYRAGVLVKAEDKDDKFLSSIVNYFWSGGGQGLRLINSFGDDLKTLEFLVDTNSSYSFRVTTDNVCNLGTGAYRWKQLFAGTATINTSDERLKDNIEAIPDDVLDAWGEVNWYQYQFKDSIAEKGETKARLHTGAIAQRIESVFKAHNLDANRYGLLCYDEWDATPSQKDENGNIITPAQPAGNRYSLRYEEALCMEAAYQRRRADRLEERIEALEKLLKK